MPIFSEQKCTAIYGNRFSSEYNICGGESEANSGACQGDSGG